MHRLTQEHQPPTHALLAYQARTQSGWDVLTPAPPLPLHPCQRPNAACATLQRHSALSTVESRVQESMQFDVGSWSVPEVCDWVEYIGLGQYRKRFVHHCVDGRLLLHLTEAQLKVCWGAASLHPDGRHASRQWTVASCCAK